MDNGNANSDTITFGSTTVGAVTITDFSDGSALSGDKLDLSAYGVTGLSDLAITEAGGNTTIDITDDANFGSIQLTGVTMAQLVADNFIFA